MPEAKKKEARTPNEKKPEGSELSETQGPGTKPEILRKLPPRRVKSDDFTLVIDGKEYHPHAGEYVDYVRGIPWGFLSVLRGSMEVDASDAKAVLTEWSRIVSVLPSCIIGWTWTDVQGLPLPAPYQNPRAFDLLSEDELVWLWQNAIPKPNPQS